MSDGFWDDAEVIHVYTRAQALEDGVLVDAGAAAREAGFRWPVGLTAAAWADAVAWDQRNEDNAALQDEAGRLWDVLTMARLATQRGGDGRRAAFEVLRIPNTSRATRPVLTRLQLLCGPGDAGEPVLTITCPGED